VSAQELTYPQKSCCSATAFHSRIEPSGFALMAPKLLILLNTASCRQLGQSGAKLAESRTWVSVTQLAHIVIHKICGQRQKRFSIIDLGAFSQMNPSFRLQLDPAPR
jgi:hypothetical protein